MATFYSSVYAQTSAASASYYSHHQQQQQQPLFQAQTRAARRGVSNGNSRYALSPATQYRQSRYTYAPPVVQKESLGEETFYRGKFEAARSFDLEDDEIYCPYLLTEDDLVSIYSGSDSSSMSSASPNQSPLQMQVYSAMPAQAMYNRPTRTPSPDAVAFKPSPPIAPARPFQHHTGPRKRNPIPIVDPLSGKPTSSPRSQF